MHVCTSSDSVYPTVPVALVLNLIIYHNAVIMERLSCFTVRLPMSNTLINSWLWFVV